MFIKLTAICVAFVPLIICRQDSENPAQSVARAANFFGCLSASKQKTPSHRIKAVNRVLGLSLGPLKVSAELHRYFGVQRHPSDHFPVENSGFPSIDGEVSEIFSDVAAPSNSLHTTDTTHLSANDAALESTTETTQAPFNSLKLKDFEEVTFDDGLKENRVRREASTDSSEAEADVTDSTTIESSTIQAQESSFDSFATLSPPSEQPNYQQFHATPSFPYPPSRNPAVQYVSITQSPHYPSHHNHPIKSYYDFHPSQPDFIPYCINWFQNTFAPIVHDTWTRDYRKWK